MVDNPSDDVRCHGCGVDLGYRIREARRLGPDVVPHIFIDDNGNRYCGPCYCNLEPPYRITQEEAKRAEENYFHHKA